MSIRVGVFGHNGKMGAEVVRAVEAADGMTYTGGADAGDPKENIADAQVVVDFTHPDAVMENIRWALDKGIHMVIGTTGFDDERTEEVRKLVEQHPGVGVILVSNFSIGANLMMKFSEIAAKYYESVEIVELHHPQKAEAPSGTARTTAKLIAASRAEAGLGDVPDATVHDGGARGGVVDGIHIHGVRLSALVAHQEVLFGGDGETLTIRHDSYQRTSFMPGVVAAVRWIVDNPGLHIGMDEVLGL